MKFVLTKNKQSVSDYWNGRQGLPDEIHVPSPVLGMAEFQLLGLLCSLHGHLTAYDLLLGADSGTDKDRDMMAVLTAFQWYIYPRMPLSHYSESGTRRLPGNGRPYLPLDPAST
jgi:hypothetical protein